MVGCCSRRGGSRHEPVWAVGHGGAILPEVAVNEAPQPALVLASGEWSEVLPAPSRPTVTVPLVVERTRPSYKREPTVLDGLEAEARRLATLSPPYRRILEVNRTAESVVLVGERFVGLTASELVKALSTEGRLLPLDVWLRLAVELTQVLDEPAPCGPAAGGGLRSLGIDVRRRLVLFTDPLIALSARHLEFLDPHPRVGNLDWAIYISPEEVVGRTETVASRVFCTATALADLLTLTIPFLRGSMMDTLRALHQAEVFWSTAAHPECPVAVGEVFRKAWSKEPERRWPSGLAFRDALLGAAGVAPASMEQAATLILSADFARVRQRLRDLEREPEWLPDVWRSGGLRVLEDELLEALPPLDRLPQRRPS